MADVFISYSRPDGEFVHRLHAALQEGGKDVWVDFEDIAPASPWARVVEEAIGASDAFVFVISPASVRSPQCRTELDRAAALNKRIVPLHLRETDPKSMPDPLSAHNWVPQIGLFEDDFPTSLRTLNTAIETDLGWLREHTRWGQKAEEWEQHGRDRSFLLSGSELEAAEAWLAGQAGKDPPPTNAQSNLVLESRRRATSSLRRQRAFIFGALVVALALAVFALVKRQQAIDNQETAKSRQLAALAEAALPSDPAQSVQYSLAALDTRFTDQAEAALRDSLPRLQLRAIVNAGAPLYAAAFSPDGREFATADTRGRVKLWNARRREVMRTWHVHPAFKGALAFGDGGRELAATGGGSAATIWNTRSGRLVAPLPHGRRVTDVAFSPDGGEVVTVGQDHEARIWTAGGEPRARLRVGPDDQLTAAAFSDDGREVVTGGTDGRVRTWSARTGRPLARVGRQRGPVGDVVFGRHDQTVLTAGLDFKARIWDARGGGLLRTLSGHTGVVHSIALSPNGAKAVTASADGGARIWDVRTGEQLNSLSGHGGPVLAASFNPNTNGRILTASYDRTVRIWDAASRYAVAGLRTPGGVVDSAAYSPDGKEVVTASRGGTTRIWNAANRRVVGKLRRDSQPVNAAAFSPDGSEIVTASQGGDATVWDAATERRLETLPGKDPLEDAAFNRDGTRIVTAGFDGTATVWNVSLRRRVTTLGGSAVANSAAFSPDGRRIVTASSDGKARIWNLATQGMVHVLRDHIGPVQDAQWSPDGREVVTAGADRTVRIWNASTGDEALPPLHGHSGPVYTAEFNHAGTEVVSAGADGTARIWDASTGRQLTTLGSFSGPLNGAAWRPDGARVVTASTDGTATVWSTELSGPRAKLEAIARTRLTQIGTPYASNVP